ncbi:MAG TPA: helix-turn-helix domain-containing protein [Trebonia sp.]|jgi:DNA-binding transcriptional ArsR family regulator|nr:helix-turn-helix domain-containing protein [Trebonia sp.]
MPESHDQERTAEDAAPYRFENPRSIRALAHPARLAIIDALAAGEELTATQCAELTGLSPSATAYHLKLLQRYGAVEAAPPRPDRRERPWRAAARGFQADLDTSTPARASAAAAVAAAHFDATRAIGVEFTESADAEPEEWRNGVLDNADLWLTAEEFQRVGEELAAVVERYRGRAPRGGHPAGSRLVRVMNVVVPRRRIGT